MTIHKTLDCLRPQVGPTEKLVSASGDRKELLLLDPPEQVPPEDGDRIQSLKCALK
jgi:hypothetical protein